MKAQAAPLPVDILLVEDNPDDVFLTREAFREGKVASRLSAASSGQEALRFLRGEGEHAGAPRPHLILLDLNLPGMSGSEVLESIKSDAKLMDIPVIVLTTSRAEEDVLEAYRRHANCYISKPLDLAEFAAVVERINDFWFSVVTLPRSARAGQERKPR